MYENGYIREDMVLHQCYSGLRDNCKEVSHIVGFVIKCSICIQSLIFYCLCLFVLTLMGPFMPVLYQRIIMIAELMKNQ